VLGAVLRFLEEWPESESPNKYIIIYKSSSDHDCCKVWCEANSPEDAASQTLQDYWDVEEIISIRRM